MIQIKVDASDVVMLRDVLDAIPDYSDGRNDGVVKDVQRLIRRIQKAIDKADV